MQSNPRSSKKSTARSRTGSPASPPWTRFTCPVLFSITKKSSSARKASPVGSVSPVTAGSTPSASSVMAGPVLGGLELSGWMLVEGWIEGAEELGEDSASHATRRSASTATLRLEVAGRRMRVGKAPLRAATVRWINVALDIARSPLICR